MPDRLMTVAVWLLRPVEWLHEWTVRRAYARGRFAPPTESAGAVTTRRTK